VNAKKTEEPEYDPPFSSRISKELVKWLKVEAAMSEVSIQSLLEEAIRDLIAKRKRNEKRRAERKGGKHAD
jgi:predicted HicB family RNase H-like nuclease